MPTKKTTTTSKPVDVEVKPKVKSKPTKMGGKTFTIEITIPPADGANFRNSHVLQAICFGQANGLIAKEVQAYLEENK